MRINAKKLGASLMATGPLLMQFAAIKALWWAGFAFLIAGPILLSVEQEKLTSSSSADNPDADEDISHPMARGPVAHPLPPDTAADV